MRNFYENELPFLEKFFAQFSSELEVFAEKHYLLIDKYWHQLPSWRFSFRHLKGGIGSFELIKETDSLVKIYSYWWIDDFDEFTRFSKRVETSLFEVNKLNITEKLEERFTNILSWELDDWTEITNSYGNIWNIYSKEEFYKLNDKYPIPKF
jgi:hypothetical protein